MVSCNEVVVVVVPPIYVAPLVYCCFMGCCIQEWCNNN